MVDEGDYERYYDAICGIWKPVGNETPRRSIRQQDYEHQVKWRDRSGRRRAGAGYDRYLERKSHVKSVGP